jgi:membrane-associated protease RseP (regulator of RpoE activity)
MLADARIPDAETANLSAVGNSPKANFIPTTGANSSRTSDKGNPPVIPQQSVAGPRPVAAENESGNELSTAIAETTHELRANVDQGHGGYFGATSNDTARVRHNGVTLSGVELNGPAYAAGLQAGDVILAMDGKYIYTVEEMTAEIRRRTPGTRIDIKYMRGGTIYETYAVLVGTARF